MFPTLWREEKKKIVTLSYTAGYDNRGALQSKRGTVTQLNRMWRASCSGAAEKMWLFKAAKRRSGTGQASSVEA